MTSKPALRRLCLPFVLWAAVCLACNVPRGWDPPVTLPPSSAQETQAAGWYLTQAAPTEDLEQPEQPAAQIPGLGTVVQEGDSLTNEYRVSVFYGNAVEFQNPPRLRAFANAADYASPTGIQITHSPGERVMVYLQWVWLLDEGLWLQMETAGSETALGVQIWGDTDDGWVNVLVDGNPVWKGFTRGEDEYYPGGAYVYYVQVADLPLGPHTMRVENAGEGPSSVYYFGVGEVR
jgi:hypothetical protein